MKIIRNILLYLLCALLVLILAFNIWGAVTLGKIVPATAPELNTKANQVVMVFGATGSVGDGLLKAAIEDPAVEKVYVVTRSTSKRIEEGVATGKVQKILQQDFTDYSNLGDILGQVNTVLWGLGTSSLNVDDDTYTRIHVDYPVAFVNAWLSARQSGPMSFHYVTGMGTDANGEQHWAREKGRAENELATMAAAGDLRTFAYRSAFVRPTSEQSNTMHYIAAALLRPGALVIPADALGDAMLEISARTQELPNGTLIDNADSIAYAQAYQARQTERQ
ncbi:MAG: NmrA family NAD(P)-binding protein [Halioglobus sp.]